MAEAAKRSALGELTKGFVKENPVLRLVLGTCPTLAISTSVENAIGMGIAATLVLIMSNAVISALRKVIPSKVRVPCFIVVIAAFVSMIQLLVKAFAPALDAALGIYLPLIVVNCIILARAEAFASKNPVLPSAVDGLAMGLGFTAALTLLASVREIIGSGTWLGLPVMPAAYRPALIFILPAGAFLTMGMLAALVNKGRSAAAAYAEAHPKPEKIEVLPDEIVTEATPEEEAPAEEASAPADETSAEAAPEVTDTPAEEPASAVAAPAAEEAPAAQETEPATNEESEETTNGTTD